MRDWDRVGAVEILYNTSMLGQWLSRAELSTLLEYVEHETHVAGEVVFQTDALADSLLFVLTGELQIVIQEQLLLTASTGSLIGEGMFSPEAVRIASVTAVTDCTVVSFSLHDFQRMLDKHRALAMLLEKRFSQIYTERRNANRQHFYVDPNAYLALIAHDKMKASLIDFVLANREAIQQFPLVATGTTGRLIYQETGLLLSKKVKSGPLGGDQAIGQMISTNNIAGIIFFRDPLSAHPHQADINALGRLCDVYQIPFASNPSTANAVLQYLMHQPQPQDPQLT